jgi:hypothetical protein
VKELSDHLTRFSSAPFLFVGSGLSRRYIGLPDWEGLLKEFAGELDQPYDFYRASGNSNLPQVAQLISQDFHKLWWSAPRFAQSRLEFSGLASGISSALKIEICQYLLELELKALSTTSTDELTILRSAVIDGIITTNWDCLMESLFPEYRSFVGQNELLFSTTQGVGEIYKIHGCRTQVNSLVLTEEDYTDYSRRNPYLSAKLLTIFVEHPILFLGYSLSDPNIHQILALVASSLTSENIDRLQDRLIVVSYSPSDTVPTFIRTQIMVEGIAVPVIEIKTKSFNPIYESLSSFKRKFSAKVLRQLKEEVYDLVLLNDPKGQLYVQDIEELGASQTPDIVLGVGARKLLADVGYTRIDRLRLIEDLIFQNHTLDSSKVVGDLLPELLKSTHYHPMCKYLKLSGVDMSDETGQHVNYQILESFDHNRKLKNIRPHLTLSQKSWLDKNGSNATLLAKYASDRDFIEILPYVQIHEEDIEVVRNRLKESFKKRILERRAATLTFLSMVP